MMQVGAGGLIPDVGGSRADAACENERQAADVGAREGVCMQGVKQKLPDLETEEAEM